MQTDTGTDGQRVASTFVGATKNIKCDLIRCLAMLPKHNDSPIVDTIYVILEYLYAALRHHLSVVIVFSSHANQTETGSL